MRLHEVRDYIDMMYGPPLNVLAECLRGFVTAAPGNKLIAVDFSQVETRVLAWLAGEESVLKILRTHGKLYEATAAKIFGIDMEKVVDTQRQIGKVSILACGYQGGVNAFQTMAKTYLVKIPDSQAEDIKDKWRAAHPAICAYWYKLEAASVAACQHPNEKFHAGPSGKHVTFLRKGSFLMCRLPSGRVIFYPYPEMRLVTTPWGDRKLALTYKTEVNRQWRRIPSYGGLLAENVTQAVSRDLLRAAMHRWERAGYPVVLHVHDELVAEVPKDGGKTLEEAKELMCIVPKWAEGLPVAGDGWEGERYRK